MDIKTLMIGDWVMISPISYYQVEQIRMEFGELRIYLKGTEVFATENEIMPIPLTPEILEKNFESESNIFGLQTYKLNENFNLENRGDRFSLVRKCSDYYSSTFWICDLMHLHQLQQVLRFLGIEKEIEL